MKYLLPVLPILLAFAVVQPSSAQQRFFGGSCAPSYAPVYHPPVYTQPVYHAPVETIVVREVIVPVFTPLAVVVDPRLSYHYTGFNSVALSPYAPQQQFGGQFGGFGAQQQPLAQPAPAPAAQTNENLDTFIDAVDKRRLQRQRGYAVEPPGPPPVPGFSPQRDIVPKVSALQVLSTHCAECHTGPRSKGSFVIFDTPGKLAAGFNQRKAWKWVDDGLMPPRERARLKKAEIAALE
jgi:hypothetical protein